MTKSTSLFICYFLIIFNFSPSYAQVNKFGFRLNDSIEVKDINGNTLINPWVGGLNSAHFQQIDFNLDGKLDLIVVEKHGGKVLTFINNGGINQISYKHAPEYEWYFPQNTGWIQCIDYNHDGKNDVFMYNQSAAGIMVYKNTSTTAGGFSLQMVKYYIESDYGGGIQNNLYCGPTDYPAICDIDNDGDLDVLNFGVMGTYIEYHRNYSKELDGDYEHFNFKRKDNCWGKFAESEISNGVILNINCVKSADEKTSKHKHVGSSILAMDLNGDSVKDLLLGDVDFLNVVALINGGTKDSAYMISQDSLFPFYNTPVDITSFPVMNYIDVDNDGINELIVSVFEESWYKTQGKYQCWLYDNTGTNNLPVFTLVKKNFLQEQMMDFGENASPAIVDVNGDGLMDVIVGNYGYFDSSYVHLGNLYSAKSAGLTYLKNTGTSTNPSFQIIDTNWANIKSYGQLAMKPTFGDIDGDGDMDMILGLQNGQLMYFQNTAGAGNPITFANPVQNYNGIDVGDFAAPQLFDLNNDTLLDLIVGKRNGYLSFYKNTGSTQNPIFTLQTDSLGNVNTNDYWNYYTGFSSPFFYKNSNDSICLMSGSASGCVFFYSNIDGNLNGNFDKDSSLVYYPFNDTIYSAVFFHRTDNVHQFVDETMRSAPVLYDFNGDGFLDMINGNFAGGLSFYKGIQPLNTIEEATENMMNCQIYPNPAQDVIHLNFNDVSSYETLNISILDILGKTISTQEYKVQNNINIPLNFLPTNGFYFIQIQARLNNGQYIRNMKKFIKI